MYEVLPLAVEYQIKDIKGRCESYLEKNLSLKTLVIAEKYDLDQLKNSCLAMVKGKTLKALKAEPEYKLLSKENLEKLLMVKYNEMENLLMAKYNEMEKKAKENIYNYETVLRKIEQMKRSNEEYEEKISEIRNELRCYIHQFFYNDWKVPDKISHIRKCNFENSTGTNPGGQTWSHSNRCDYCLCQKLKKLII